MHQSIPPTRTSKLPSWALALAIVVWLGAATSTWYSITAFGFSGHQVSEEEARAAWPEASSIVRHAQRPTLLLFLHPHCACSRATVEELERLNTLAPASS